MASIEVDIDIEDYLDEVDTSDLIEELKSRKDRKDYNGLDSITQEDMVKILTDNLADEMKLEEFLSKFKNIPQAELTTFLNNYK